MLRRLDEHNGGVGQAAHQLRDVLGGDVVVGAHPFGCVEAEAAREDAQALKVQSLGCVELGVRPLDHRAEAAMPWTSVPATGRQQREPVGQPLCEVLHVHRTQPCSGEFDRQRQVIEAGAHLDDRIGVSSIRFGRTAWAQLSSTNSSRLGTSEDTSAASTVPSRDTATPRAAATA